MQVLVQPERILTAQMTQVPILKLKKQGNQVRRISLSRFTATRFDSCSYQECGLYPEQRIGERLR
jgi:hypothetical protein